MAKGNVAGARQLLQQAAEACDTEAAFALGTTYDPGMLRNFGMSSVAPDVAIARAWYERAKQLGSAEAADQLDSLPLGK